MTSNTEKALAIDLSNPKACYIDDPSVVPRTSVRVLDSNLSQGHQDQLAGALARIYDSIEAPIDRVAAFHDVLRDTFPKLYPSVIINFTALTYYAKHYFIELSANDDRVFAFGFKL